MKYGAVTILGSMDLKPKETITHSIFGATRTFADLDRWEIFFLVFGGVSLVACTGLTTERLVYLSPDHCPHWSVSNHTSNPVIEEKRCGAEFTFALLVLVNCGFLLFHIIHGTLTERPYELFAFVVGIAIVSCYCTLDFIVGVEEGLSGFSFRIKLARLIILLTLGVTDVLLACHIALRFLKAGRFASNVAKSYDEILQRKVKVHFAAQSLLTLDLEFQVTMVILILRNGFELGVGALEMGILFGGSIFSVLWMVCAIICMRLEKRLLSWIVIGTSVLEPAYILYKIIDSAKSVVSIDNTDYNSLVLHYCVFLGGTVGLLIRLLLLPSFIYTYSTFGENLNKKIYDIETSQTVNNRSRKPLSSEEPGWDTHEEPGSLSMNR
ncbi:hypothetical protein RvY_09168 [Ramazzottius varieornatus]|uniref:DUF7789 domain-containing protein n=1 Tax=Ramazzottius varieornatus TaxID=947166 RepID=A0A1D1VGC4_RAMVA|nr:hypothetical protein RvY_09168 [Ramazzottius varieornatus]